MEFAALSIENENTLRQNRYPGRLIIAGMTQDKNNFVLVYSIMGRSENSRNRIFKKEKNNRVITEAFDITKLKDPSLVIYNASVEYKNSHILTNGMQTDTIFEYMQEGSNMENALSKWTFEPDPPIYTPRISCVAYLNKDPSYEMAILKSTKNNPDFGQRHFFKYNNPIPGFGHCIHTYAGDGDPVPSFNGEPYIVSVKDTVDENINYYWDILDSENKVSIFVKFINIETGKSEIKIINKNKK